MERGAFLRLLGDAGAGATLDHKYFFAPAAGWNRICFNNNLHMPEFLTLAGPRNPHRESHGDATNRSSEGSSINV